MSMHEPRNMLRADCVAQISGWPEPGRLVFPLREADVLRTPEFQHPV